MYTTYKINSLNSIKSLVQVPALPNHQEHHHFSNSLSHTKKTTKSNTRYFLTNLISSRSTIYLFSNLKYTIINVLQLLNYQSDIFRKIDPTVSTGLEAIALVLSTYPGLSFIKQRREVSYAISNIRKSHHDLLSIMNLIKTGEINSAMNLTKCREAAGLDKTWAQTCNNDF